MATQQYMKDIPDQLAKPTVTDFLISDHLDTVILFEHFKKAHSEGDHQLQEMLSDAIATLIRLHSQAEIDVLYPFIEQRLKAEGKQKVEESLEEHNKVESEVMKAIQLRKAGDENLLQTMETIRSTFYDHLIKEENEIMTKLLDKASQADLIQLGINFQTSKENAALEPQPPATPLST